MHTQGETNHILYKMVVCEPNPNHSLQLFGLHSAQQKNKKLNQYIKTG